VQKVQVLSNKNDVERQLLLVKVAAGVKEREGLMRLVDIFKAKVLDVTKSSMILEITGRRTSWWSCCRSGSMWASSPSTSAGSSATSPPGSPPAGP